MLTDAEHGRDVVLVHGLWIGRWAMALLARRLGHAGFTTRSFSYPTTRHDMEKQVEKLYRFACSPENRLPHFVAHSMGGLITLQMLEDHPQTPSGRVVLMGSPLAGSSVARRVSQWPAGRVLFGAAETTLIEGVRAWPDNREIGMIAGTRPLGLGLLAGGAGAKGDGTVLAEESRHEALDDYLELPVTHTSMLFSKEVARQAIAFLSDGRFAH